MCLTNRAKALCCMHKCCHVCCSCCTSMPHTHIHTHARKHTNHRCCHLVRIRKHSLSNWRLLIKGMGHTLVTTGPWWSADTRCGLNLAVKKYPRAHTLSQSRRLAVRIYAKLRVSSLSPHTHTHKQWNSGGGVRFRNNILPVALLRRQWSRSLRKL